MRHLLLAAALASALVFLVPLHDSTPVPAAPPKVATKAEANEMMQRQPACFVPNLGQWKHRAKFVHRNGPMTLFLEDRGWVLDLVERPVKHKARRDAAHQAVPGDRDVEQKIRGVTLQMTFEGEAYVPEIVGEQKFAGHHNYFLGNDESRWRTGVPLYSSIRYENLYPGIDLRLREMNGVPEYDLLLQPGADLSQVTVHVEGAQGLSIANDGSLVIETALGPVTQSVPKTWQVGADGRKREVVCNFTLLDADRFGFAVPGWDGDTSLTIDPGLIWSTFLGGSHWDYVNALSVDASGVVTVAGQTWSNNFPTIGAYNAFKNGKNYSDVFVSRLDPSNTGNAQLVYSTYLGGGIHDNATALSVDASGVVTVAGYTGSPNFPTTRGAYDTTLNAPIWYDDVFVSRLDSSRLVYSTFLGGGFYDNATALSVDASGVTTVAGYTSSTDFPTTSGAYDTTHNGSGYYDAFVSRLDSSKTGTAQLSYSTFLGGGDDDSATALSVDASGVVTVAGWTRFHTTKFPTTSGAYDTTHNGSHDAFVSRLDPRKTGTAQLVYSTFLGGVAQDQANAVSAGASGVVTVAGYTGATNFPTTNGAYDTTFNGYDDAFVSRLDPSKTGTAQLVYSTFLGGRGRDVAHGLSVDAGGVATLAGFTTSTEYPSTRGAYDTTYNGWYDDAFVSRLSMGVTLRADWHELSLKQAGTQNLWLEAGKVHANRSYAIFGSVTGTSPGITLLGIHIPLNPDAYTEYTAWFAAPPIFVNFKGALDSLGEATASFNVPSGLPPLPGITLYHAYIVFDNSGFHMASNAVPITLKN